MIARIWHGVTLIENSKRFLEYIKNTGVKACIDTDGNQGVYVLWRPGDVNADFLFISFWESYESIRIFAGQDIENPFYFPDDEKFLIEPEKEVKHYEVQFMKVFPDPPGK